MKALLAAALLVIATSALSQESDVAELAKKVQDPTADIVSVPIQFNYYSDTGPFGRGQTVTNIQPVYPMSVSKDWKLITRYILPVINAPTGESGNEFGTGDLNLTAWLSPKAGGVTWGAGLTAGIPIASSSILGSEKWTVGPSVVGVLNEGPWVLGGLLSDSFSIAGSSDRPDVHLLTMQPFINYNLAKGEAISAGPIITYDFERDSGDRLTLPLGAGFSKTTLVAKKPIKFAGFLYYNAVRPENASLWQTQFSVTFIIPR